MGIENIYPKGKGFEPLYAEKIDIVASDLPAVDTLGRPAELAKAPGAIEQLILERAADGLRRIDEIRRALAHYASVAYELVEKHPDVVETLPQHQQDALHELATRVIIEPTEG